jgi:signal transduction histidine kinase
MPASGKTDVEVGGGGLLLLKELDWTMVGAYGIAIGAVAVGTICLRLMDSRWQESAPASLFLVAVIVSAWLGGSRPGLLALVLSLLAFSYYYVGIPGSASGDAPVQAVRLLSFVLVAAYVVWITATEKGVSDSLRRARDSLQRSNDVLRAENASQHLLNLVLQTLPVGVAVTDRAGDIILCNAASRRIWGEQMIHSGSERWVRSPGFWHESGERVAAADWPSVRALRDGKLTLNELIDIDAFDGRHKTIEASAAPIRNADESIVGAVLVLSEVTERVRAERALQDSASRLQHLSRRLLAVQEEERSHLSRELHDEFGQLLAAISLHVHAAGRIAGEAAETALAPAVTLLQRAGAQLRTLAFELRPRMLESAGLDATLRWLAEEHQQRTGSDTQVVGHVNGASGDLATACFRVVQEALTNVARHAAAQRVRIELARRSDTLDLAVIDDGVGFDAAATLEGAAGRGHLGLVGMRERVEILGGTLQLDSAPGRGTRIRIVLPLVALAATPEAAAG